jgi:hypothetical protein
MTFSKDRREFLQLVGIGGGIVFASGLARGASRSLADGAQATSASTSPKQDDFFFLQLSDTHWGFSGPPNPEASHTLKDAVAAINASKAKPDFIVFTGDLTHTTDDEDLRRKRMAEFKEIIKPLDVRLVKFIPGEHDASLDEGKAFIESFGETHGSFDHKGIHFVMLDNVSDPGAIVGQKQIDWLKSDLSRVEKDVPVVVFAHRPLFDLYPQWDWSTRDGDKVVEVLQTRANVTVFYGHIHQENHHMTGAIAHHSAKSLIFPLPAPGSVPKKAPVAWDPDHPGKGLGWRRVDPKSTDVAKRITEIDIGKA